MIKLEFWIISDDYFYAYVNPLLSIFASSIRIVRSISVRNL